MNYTEALEIASEIIEARKAGHTAFANYKRSILLGAGYKDLVRECDRA